MTTMMKIMLALIMVIAIMCCASLHTLDVMLSTLNKFIIIIPHKEICYHPHFADEEIDAARNDFPKSYLARMWQN